MSNRARVGDAFELLAAGLEPYVSRLMAPTGRNGEDWAEVFARNARNPIRDYSTSDPSFLLRVMIECWDNVFERRLPRSIRNLLFALRDKRNDWAHNKPIQAHDAQFTLSGIVTLLEAVEAREVDRARTTLAELNQALPPPQRHESSVPHRDAEDARKGSRSDRLAGIRIHELAVELGLSNKETLDVALALGIGVKTHSSLVDDLQADRVRQAAEVGGRMRTEQPDESPPARAPEITAGTTDAAPATARKEREEPQYLRVLRTWVDYSPTLFTRDLAVLDLLAAQGPMTEDEITRRLPDTSQWTFRRLSTGVHKDRRQSRPLIERERGMWRLAQKPIATAPVTPTQQQTSTP